VVGPGEYAYRTEVYGGRNHLHQIALFIRGTGKE
jgi:hypothetical protein